MSPSCAASPAILAGSCWIHARLTSTAPPAELPLHDGIRSGRGSRRLVCLRSFWTSRFDASDRLHYARYSVDPPSRRVDTRTMPTTSEASAPTVTNAATEQLQ